jgi:hypothetical protein
MPSQAIHTEQNHCFSWGNFIRTEDHQAEGTGCEEWFLKIILALERPSWKNGRIYNASDRNDRKLLKTLQTCQSNKSLHSFRSFWLATSGWLEGKSHFTHLYSVYIRPQPQNLTFYLKPSSLSIPANRTDRTECENFCKMTDRGDRSHRTFPALADLKEPLSAKSLRSRRRKVWPLRVTTRGCMSGWENHVTRHRAVNVVMVTTQVHKSR